MKRLLTIFAFVVLVAGAGYSRDKITIAVTELERTGGASIDIRSATEALQTALVKRSEFIVVERSRIDQALREQSLNMSGMISGAEAMKLGQFIGASKIIVGSVGWTSDHYVIQVRAIDSESGVVSFADMVMAWDEQGVLDVMPELAKRIAKLATGGRVADYRLPARRTETTRQPEGERRGIRLPRFQLRGIGIEFSPTYGSVLKFTNSNLYGLGVTLKIPGYNILQLDATLDYLFGNLTIYSKIWMFRFHPGLLINFAENNFLVLGVRLGYAFEICNIKEISAGLFAAGIYPFNQNALTASIELGIKFSPRIHLKAEWEFGYPVRFRPHDDIDPIDMTVRAQTGIDQIEAGGGIMTSLWSVKLDIIY